MPRKNGFQPATQAQLKATRTQLEVQLKAVETRLETRLTEVESRLDAKIDRVAVQVARNTARFDELETSLRDEMRRNTDRLAALLDPIRGRLDDNDRTVLVFDQLLKDHNQRIKRLEARSA